MALTNAGILFIAADIIGETLTEFNNANAHIGVGSSTTAFDATHTDLQAATEKLKKPMAGGYPTRTGTPATTLTFRSSFGTTEANFTWVEWGVFNGSGAGTAGPTGVVMLNRKVESPNLGTKTSAEVWQLTVTVTPTRT